MEVKTILVAVDFSENAEAAFEVAHNLARQLGAKLHVLHVQDENTLRTAIREGLLDESTTDEELEAAVKKHNLERMTDLLSLAGTDGVQIETSTERGDPKALIPDCAGKVGADLVVVGRRGLNLIERVVGRVTDSVIRRSPCPVLIVRREHRKQ